MYNIATDNGGFHLSLVYVDLKNKIWLQLLNYNI